MADRYGEEHLHDHFADTSDTLCYATNENQNATYALIQQGADMGIVVGGYNSSNTLTYCRTLPGRHADLFHPQCRGNSLGAAHPSLSAAPAADDHH